MKSDPIKYFFGEVDPRALAASDDMMSTDEIRRLIGLMRVYMRRHENVGPMDLPDMISQDIVRLLCLLNRGLAENYERNREAARQIELRRRKRKDKSSLLVISRQLRKAVYERDDYRCVKCGSRFELSCDHIQPASKGGLATLENLATLCKPCNSRKGNRVEAVLEGSGGPSEA